MSTRPWITGCPQWHQPVNRDLTGRHASKSGASPPNTQTSWPAESFFPSPVFVSGASTYDLNTNLLHWSTQDTSLLYVLTWLPSQQSIKFNQPITLTYQSSGDRSFISIAIDFFYSFIIQQQFLWQLLFLTCTTPPFQLIQKLRNSSQERMPGVAALTSGSPILPKEIQERVFCLPPSTISSISAVSWGLAERAKWASLWVLTATWNWFIRAGFFTYWYSYLLGVEMWILSEMTNEIHTATWV